MSFYLRKEWLDQSDGIERVFIHYAVTPLDESPDWQVHTQTRELLPEAGGTQRKRRAKVLKLPRMLAGEECYRLHYYFRVNQQFREWTTETFVEEIVADGSFTFIDHTGIYTNICVYWSLDGWGAPNYSTMFVDGIRLDHPLSSLHFYGRAHDGHYIYERRALLDSLPLPHVYRGKVHGPRGARLVYDFHIMRRGDPDGHDFDFYDNNDGLDYQRTLE